MVVSDAPVGASFRVLRVMTGREVGKRLADMGFTEGAEGAVVRGGFLHGPFQVRIRGYDILIRRSEAAEIEIEPLVAATRRLRIALAGNPNAGKTSLFNALTGAHRKVGNYPGVTVEKLEGSRFRDGHEYRFIDLPGIYSLTAYSIDEVVARDFLLDERPDLIVDVLDSTNLERNLFLCLQFQELGIPVVGALNMSDEAEAKGVRIDDKALSALLGIAMVRTVGTKGSGLEALLDAIDAAADGRAATLARGEAPVRKSILYGAEVESRVEPLEAGIASDGGFASRFPARWLAIKLLEKDENAYGYLARHRDGAALAAKAREAAAWIERHYGKDAELVVSEQRYGYIRGAVKETVRIVAKPSFSVTEKLDAVIMNRFLALPIFVFVLWGVFRLTFSLGAFPQAWLEASFSWLGGAISSVLPAGFLRSLLVDGIIAGVGSVFSFVPLIIILFFLLSLLEDVGYMSRAAFATDKFLHAFGLHGQSIFPMMLGFGCSVPAIMAARTLKSRRDRIVTILVIPFMSCGAKLPVYVLLAGAFFPRKASGAVMLIYAIGVALSLVVAMVLKRTILSGDPTPFVMELPPYRAPTLRGVLWHVWEKTQSYLKKMGTVIMAASILVWAITTFPASPGQADPEAVLEHSAAGSIGRLIEPAFKPIGFDWKLSVATLTGFAAKEVTVSTLGILYRVGSDARGEGASLRDALRSDPGWNPLLAFTFMLFTLAIPPCLAAMATIKTELGWGWLGFEILFLLSVGWALCFAVFRLGTLFGLGGAGA
jgi:ferrous iron transport protein B